MRGRVMALWSVAWLGSTPIGGPIVGWIGQSFGARWSLVVGGLATVAAGLLGYASLKRIDQRALASSSAGSADIGSEPESPMELPAAVQVSTQFEP
jgi:MFS family permease